jgi:hypothetical protein
MTDVCAARFRVGSGSAGAAAHGRGGTSSTVSPTTAKGECGFNPPGDPQPASPMGAGALSLQVARRANKTNVNF